MCERGTRLHLRFAQILVRLRQAVAGNAHPRCIESFEPHLSSKKSRGPFGHLDFLVREMGLEPTRRNHTHLKRACLPFQHSRKCLNIITLQDSFVNTFFLSFRVVFRYYV